ncbi:MAG: hypothetical protein KFF72_14690 [Arthrospira sp. SH-MAG29]|nr:hypothetical protein [Arthrospira sp. SH-MAG29]MBS0017573.1 hypothetical protein [Arthrospira sp. SH-MAG29]
MVNRRYFLSAGATLSAVGFASLPQGRAIASPRQIPTGALTFYAEIRVAEPENVPLLEAIKSHSQALQNAPGFLSLSLKQMTGDSTMVKNYPESYKGLLATAYADAVAAHSLPYFYSLFVRFADYDRLQEARVDRWFDQVVAPHLHAYRMTPQGPEKTPMVLESYRGIYKTVVAGDRTGIYRQPEEILAFLRHPVDLPDRDYVTVENHVMILDAVLEPFEAKTAELLLIAQQTYQPTTASDGIGFPGAADNRDYRKALSTEILRNAFPDGDLRAYLMHGVWESVWDHENSHLDPRFKQTAAPVGAMVVNGPVEPFYATRIVLT